MSCSCMPRVSQSQRRDRCHPRLALTDALREVSDPDGRPIEIIWDGVAVLRSLDKPTYVAVRELLREVDEERSDLTVTIVDR